jgi:hypothetical protein
MDMPDLNHTLLLLIALLVSLTRLVRLLFTALRVCVEEYCEFREWLKAYAAARRERRTAARRNPPSGGVTPGENVPPAPSAVRQ